MRVDNGDWRRLRNEKLHCLYRLSNIVWVIKFNTKKYHVFAPMGRFQLESIYLYFPKIKVNSWDDGGK